MPAVPLSLWTRAKASNGWTQWQQQEAIVSKSLSTNGYIKYASGLVMQWGVAIVSMAEVGIKKNIALPIGFTDSWKNLVYSKSNNDTRNTYSIMWFTSNLNEIYYKLVSNDSTSTLENDSSLCWFVIGK